ncbi:MAG: N-6 DNA methylase, partial [Limisphaerales bacterium]
MQDQRSSIAPQNIQEILDASASPKAALQTGQQQYRTPKEWARFFAVLLPSDVPEVVFDPQCATGGLFEGFGYSVRRFGVELDRRIAEVDVPHCMNTITGNCVRFWELLDDLFPEVRFDCQVANPPFGLRWKTAADPVDSTEHTWNQVLSHAAPDGYGYFIANADTLERLGMTDHPWVYLYQRFPAGLFPGTAVEVGVLHWYNY